MFNKLKEETINDFITKHKKGISITLISLGMAIGVAVGTIKGKIELTYDILKTLAIGNK